MADELDFQSSFENTLDVEVWLNKLLDNPTDLADLTALDRRVSSVLSSLEIVSEDTSTQLERIIDDISRGAPRLAYDLHFMKEGAVSLQTSLQKLQNSSTSTGSAETQVALERLHHLDLVKRNMEAARDVLREAESWSSLESEVLSLLSEQNYEKAAETLSEAAKSMVVFQNTPEYEPRRALMVSLQNQLEASLSSALVAAINSQDVAVCRSYFSIFSNIQRESEFRNYYYGSRRTDLVKMWQTAHLRDVDSDAAGNLQLLAGSQTFAAFLSTFYGAFLSLLEVERVSIPSIFPDPQATLSSLISAVLSALQPTISQRIPSVVNHYGPTALTELITSYTASMDFATSAENVMEKLGYSAPPPMTHQGSDDSDGLKQSRRRSRLSISRRMGSRNSISLHGAGSAKSLLSLSHQEWQHELFEPFLDYQVDYGSLEQKFLVEKLDRLTENESSGKTKDGARWLKERSVDVFSLAEQSLTRCIKFTHGYAAVGLIQALDYTFKSVIEVSRDDISNTPNRAASFDRGGGEDLSDMDYTAQDWARIQMFLHLLEATKGFHDRLLAFENKLKVALVQVVDTMRSAQTDLFGSGRSASGTARGALQILAQSTLNSVELQDLLKGFEPEPLLSAPPTTPRPSPHTVVSATIPQTPLMTNTRAAVSGFARTCQVSLQRTILSPLHKHLAGYSSSSVWTSKGDPTSRAPGARGNLHVPIFSISPTETVQRVAEGLLNLPRLFEVYADDDALSFSIETLPFVDEELLKSAMESVVVPGSPGPTPTSGQHVRRSPSISFRHPVSSPGPGALTPEAVSSAWLSSLALSLLSYTTSSILPGIKSLSTAGAAQLASDLGYLGNVVQALNVHSVELEKWKELVDMNDEEGRNQVKERHGAGDHIFNLVARIRGWNL